MIEFGELRRDVTTFLMSLRQAVDRPYRGSPPFHERERERFTRSMIIIEEARVRFNSLTRYREEPSKEVWKLIRQELLEFSDLFISSRDIDPAVFDRRFRIAPIGLRERENASQFIASMLARDEITVAEALISFRSYIEGVDVELASTQTVMNFGDLERIVPRQQVAPVQFDVVDGRIVVRHQSSCALESDRGNVAAALDHIKGAGEKLIESLKNSNCDRRLLESVEELHSQICSGENVVKIGLTNMACGIMGGKFQEELPDAVSAMVGSYNASISMYVSQFPDWENFTQKAAKIDVDEDDVAEVYVAAGDLLDSLENNKKLVDPEVPKTIAFVRQFLTLPGASAKRAAFAMIRTIENLVSSIFHHSISFFSKTAEKTVESASTVASKVIIGLLSVALVGASGIGPAAIRTGAPWVQQAAEIVQKQIDELVK